MRISLCHRLLPALTLLAALALCGGPARAQSPDTLYPKAKAEGALVIYAGGPTAPWDAFAKAFSARYPGIGVSIVGGFSNVLDRKIDAQRQAGKLDVDLAVFQTLQDFVRWKKEGALLPYKPPGFSAIAAPFKDPDGAFVGVQVNAHPYAYNPQLVKPGDVPRSAPDFLDGRFAGRVVAAYPADDDATLYVFDSIVRKYGWSFMDRYMANRPNFIQGHLGVVRSIASGANLVTFDTIADMSMSEKEQGKPQAIAFSQIDPLPIWPLTAGIFKASPHPEAAKLFLAWYLEPAQQAKIGTWSLRSDVPPPFGWKPVLSYQVVNDYREFLTDPQLPALRKRYEAYTGPVKNTGGVR